MSIVIPDCPDLAAVPSPLTLTLPGGVSLASLVQSAQGIPNQLDLVQSLMAQASPALAPLKPVFDIIDTVVAVFGCLKAIPAAFGPPPDPSKLVQAIEDLAKKVDNLLHLVPQLSIPLLAKDLIDAILALLEGMRDALDGLAEELKSLEGAASRAAELNDPGLAGIVACAQAGITAQAASLGASMASLGSLIGLANILLGMVGLPQIPDLSHLGSLPLDQVVKPLDALVKELRAVRQAIPI